jgi:hypothetical protein
MRIVQSLLAAIAGTLFAGCAAYSDAQLSQLSRSGVAYPTLVRMEHGHALAPADIIELSRHGVPSGTIIRHLDRYGFDGLLTRSEAAELRRAGVRPAVIDATVEASEEFADDHGHNSRVHVGWGFGWGWGPGYYY